MATQRFTVNIFSDDGTIVRVDPDVVFSPKRWGDMDYGGPDFAEIAVTGPIITLGNMINWLYYGVEILGRNNTPLWWGFISEVETQPESGATLHCLGWWHMLDARYYENLKGREENTEGSDDQDLGLSFTSSEIGTVAWDNTWYEHAGQFKNFRDDIKFVVAGSSSDGTYTTTGSASSDDVTTYTNTSISFEPNDDIKDSNYGFKDIRPNEYCEVSGSSNNDGYHLLTSAALDHMTTREGITGNILEEDAGPSFSIIQGNAVDALETVSTYEIPAANVGVTVTAYGQKIAQEFKNTTGEAFTVARIAIEVSRVGTPTDNITVELCTDSAGSPGAVVDSAELNYTGITDKKTWLWTDLANTYSIATGTSYWIVLSRVGASDPDDFYRVSVDEERTYGIDNSVNLKVYDGSAWYARPVDASMSFRVHGAIETTTQIQTMIQDNGQVFAATTIIDASGTETNQYRDGLTLTRLEVEDLLDLGTSTGGALTAHVSPGKAVMIEAREDSSSPSILLESGDSVVYTVLIDEIINRAQVFYSYTDASGDVIAAKTNWTANDDSVDRYGYRELRYSAGDMEETQAEALRDRILAERAIPSVVVDFGAVPLRWESGAYIENGRTIAGRWMKISGALSAGAGLITTSPIYIAASEYDAVSGKLKAIPATITDPWAALGISQG